MKYPRTYSTFQFLIWTWCAHLTLHESTGASVDYSCLHEQSWIINEDNDYSDIFECSTDILSSYNTNKGRWQIKTNTIPNYSRYFTSDDITMLNSRPKVGTDFVSGSTSAHAGEYYNFGEDIGYVKSSCSTGYWPPGPACPAPVHQSISFALNPAQSTSGCYTSTGQIGIFVNGVQIFNPTDGHSYQGANIWHNNAPLFEYYDMDVCSGHSADDAYHHHHFPNCLAEKLSDDGSQHSPIYGWLFDGYPLYGPYNSPATLALSCWQVRDYAADSPTGCSDGQRSCQLVDEYDYTKGKVVVATGPSLIGTVQTTSDNIISSESGIYYEDMFYNSTCSTLGAEYLDEYNGHSHDDYGYHYHITIDTNMAPVFPYLIGPKFYGCLSTDEGRCCSSISDKKCQEMSTCGTIDGTRYSGCTWEGGTFSDRFDVSDGAAAGIAIGSFFGLLMVTILIAYIHLKDRQTRYKIHALNELSEKRKDTKSSSQPLQSKQLFVPTKKSLQIAVAANETSTIDTSSMTKDKDSPPTYAVENDILDKLESFSNA